MADEKRIQIKKEDLNTAQNLQRVQQFKDAQKIALVRPVGEIGRAHV